MTVEKCVTLPKGKGRCWSKYHVWKKNFWVRKMKKIRSTDDEHISKNFFYFFLMQYNDYFIKIEIKFVHFYSCLSYFCFLPDLKIKVFIIFNLQCIYYIFHHLLFDRLKHLTKYFISPSHVSIFFPKNWNFIFSEKCCLC